jgi:hypothetical protein
VDDYWTQDPFTWNDRAEVRWKDLEEASSRTHDPQPLYLYMIDREGCSPEA